MSLCLTDKYPNTDALAKVAEKMPGVRFEAESVSALDVPERLAGFRTVFTAFHHFQPTDAREILASAVRDGQGIAVFEAASRSYRALGAMLGVPLAVWLLTPVIQPFRWSRLFWDVRGAGDPGRDAVRWARVLPPHLHPRRDEGDGRRRRRRGVRLGGRDRLPTGVGSSDPVSDRHPAPPYDTREQLT